MSALPSRGGAPVGARIVLVLLFITAGCNQTAEIKAWNARVAERKERLEQLRDLKEHFGERRAELDATIAEAAAVDLRLDLTAHVRALGRPELKLFQSADALRLSMRAPVDTCRDVLRALAPVRHLTGPWQLRIEAGECTWEASAAPELVALRERESKVTPWVPPHHSLLSTKVEALQIQAKALDSLIAAAERDLGAHAHVDALPGRIGRALSIEQQLQSKPPPCDLAVLERAVTLDAKSLLEVQRDRFIHPLEPLADERLKGFAAIRDGAVWWTCGFDAGS